MKYYAIDIAQLVSLLPERYKKRLHSLISLDVVDSTSDYLIAKETGATGVNVCLASSQKKGRGRRGNKWISPSGGNIYLSISWNSKYVHNDQWYGLAMAFSLAHYLSSLCSSFVGVKWPNDLYCNGYKLGGIILEKVKNKYIAGLGLNVVSNKLNSSDLSGGYISLQDIGVNLNDYCGIVSRIIIEMIDAIDCVANKNIKEMQDIYREYDLTYGREVTIQKAGKLLTGVAAGVDDNARLCVEVSSKLITYDADEISIIL